MVGADLLSSRSQPRRLRPTEMPSVVEGVIAAHFNREAIAPSSRGNMHDRGPHFASSTQANWLAALAKWLAIFAITVQHRPSNQTSLFHIETLTRSQRFMNCELLQ